MSASKPVYVKEALDFGNLPTIPESYDPDLALAAANRRAGRKGRLALGAATKGFNARVSGLWVPHSKGENNAVVTGIEQHTRDAVNRAKVGIETKFPDVPPSDDLISSWIRYGTERAGRNVLAKVLGYTLDAEKNVTALTSVLGPEHSYDAAAVRESEVGMSGLFSYVRSLESFVGANRRQSGDRVWVQDKHVHVKEEARQRFEDMVVALDEQSMRELFDEAVWSEWSRREFWQSGYQQLQDKVGYPYSSPSEVVELLPLEAYADLPEYHGHLDEGSYVA